MRLFTLLFLLFSAAFATAQSATLKGQVTDAANDDPLIGVSIATDGWGTSTNTEGLFTRSIEAGNYRLVFKYTGYADHTETVTLNPGQVLELKVQMGEQTNLLQTATVTAGKFEKPLGEVTVSLEVLKPKLIQSTNTTSIDEVLTKIPGLSVVDGQASIRGGSGFSYGAGTRVLMLLDDIPALQADAGLPQWDDFPVENIGQIEVLKGAASALYGSSAMNGIINLRTGFAKGQPETEVAYFAKTWGNPKDSRKKWWGTDSSFIEQPFETGMSFVHRQKKGKWDIVLGSYGLIRDSYNKETYSRYARITPNLRYRASDRLTFGVNANFNVGRSGSFFIWNNDTTGAYQPGINSASQTLGRLRFTIDPTIQYFDRFGFKHKVMGRYFYTHNNNSDNQSNDSRLYYGEYQIQRVIGNLVATGGFVGMYNRIDAELYNKAKYQTQNLAGYLQADYKIFNRLNLSAGMRYEQNKLFSPDTIWQLEPGKFEIIPNGLTEETKPVFRVGANYQVGKATYLRTSWGQGYRYPTIAEKFINTNFGGTNLVAPNAKLVSETGYTSEIGIKQGFKVAGWGGYIDLSGFVSEYQNMMEFVLDRVALIPGVGFGSIFQSQNIGTTRVQGTEISIAGQGKLGNGDLSLLTGYTYLDPTYKTFGKKEKASSSDSTKNVLKYRFRHQIKFDAAYEIGKISFGAALNYNSFMENIDFLFQADLAPPFTIAPFSAVNRYRKNKKGATVVDLRAAYKVTKHVSISVLCNNLFNTEYSQRPALLDAPRSYTMRLEYKL